MARFRIVAHETDTHARTLDLVAEDPGEARYLADSAFEYAWDKSPEPVFRSWEVVSVEKLPDDPAPITTPTGVEAQSWDS